MTIKDASECVPSGISQTIIIIMPPITTNTTTTHRQEDTRRRMMRRNAPYHHHHYRARAPQQPVQPRLSMQPLSGQPLEEEEQEQEQEQQVVVVVTDAQVLTVLALRERFTRPIMRLLNVADFARMRASYYQTEEEEEEMTQKKAEVGKAEEALREAARIEADYQWALGQAGLRAAFAATMPRLATHPCATLSFEALADLVRDATPLELAYEGRIHEAIKAAYLRSASTVELTSTTTRFVPVGAAQAELLRRMAEAYDDEVAIMMPNEHPCGERDGLTTPAGSWVVHFGDLVMPP